jgi:DNA invertase Pin-like site-specific DNA recombinase
MRYILYARKSTEEDDRQVLSIEAQLVELQEYAAKEKLEIVASFQEAKTAKEPGRIKFAEMLLLIERGKADGIISWHPDRLARNSVDGGTIIHFVDRGLIKSLKFPTFWFEPTPQGLFMLNIAFGQSKYFVDNLRENVKRGLRQKIRNGVWPGWAPVGYLNNPKTRMIDIDSSKASKVKKMFELYATGNYTLHSIANWCKENGLRGNLGKQLVIANIQKNLQNVFYLGLMKWKGEIFEGQHEPLISKKLFDKCQEVMAKRGKVQEVRKHNFAFLGFLKCASCGCSITAEKQKGHNYYRCTKKKGPYQEKHYLREEALTEQIISYLRKVSLSSQDTEKVLAALDTEQDKARESSQAEVGVLKKQLAQIEAKLQKLLDIYLADALSTEEYAAKKERLLSEKIRIEEKITEIEQKGLSWLEPAREFVLSLNQAAKLIEEDNLSEMTTFLKNIGANHILRNRQFVFEPKIQYKRAAELGEATKRASPQARLRRADNNFKFFFGGNLIMNLIHQKINQKEKATSAFALVAHSCSLLREKFFRTLLNLSLPRISCSVDLGENSKGKFLEHPLATALIDPTVVMRSAAPHFANLHRSTLALFAALPLGRRSAEKVIHAIAIGCGENAAYHNIKVAVRANKNKPNAGFSRFFAKARSFLFVHKVGIKHDISALLYNFYGRILGNRTRPFIALTLLAQLNTDSVALDDRASDMLGKLFRHRTFTGADKSNDSHNNRLFGLTPLDAEICHKHLLSGALLFREIFSFMNHNSNYTRQNELNQSSKHLLSPPFLCLFLRKVMVAYHHLFCRYDNIKNNCSSSFWPYLAHTARMAVQFDGN